MQDSHKDIILRESAKDSFLGASNYTHTHGALNNVSLMAGFENVPAILINRIILRANTFKEISQYGVMLQNCSASSVKIEGCHFTNVKEPIVINERDLAASRNNTRQNLNDANNSEFLAPSFCNTPRIGSGMPPKGTIIIKANKFEGSEHTVVKKNVWSYLYDMQKPKGVRNASP